MHHLLIPSSISTHIIMHNRIINEELRCFVRTVGPTLS